MVSPATLTRSRLAVGVRSGKYADALAVFMLLALALVGSWNGVVGGTVIGMDAATFFYPMYSFLGDSLRSWQLPAWSPYQLSGAPFAADPQSGWMYLPAMLFFSLLSLPEAANFYLVLHPLLAGLSMYALARVLGLNVPGALLAGIAYGHSGYLYDRNVRCFACAGVTAWLPLVILCAEMAIRSRSWRVRMLWWGGAGFALSQIYASWLGQGSYYALLALGGYIAYRTLISPPEHLGSQRARVAALASNGLGVLLFSFGLAAAGLVPRLEYNTLSTLAGGYGGSEEQAVHGGLSVRQWGALIIGRHWYYAGGAVLALALLAPAVARRSSSMIHHAVPYWTALAVCALILTGGGTTPLHWVAYLLPGFARLHPHDPERIILLVYFGTALLAGATVSALAERGRRAAALLAVPVLATLALLAVGIKLSSGALVTIGIACLCVALVSLMPASRRVVYVLLPVVVFVDLFATAQADATRRLSLEGPVALRKVDLEEYYDRKGAGEWLRKQKDKGPFRYFGYNPRIGNISQPYQTQFTDPRATSLLVPNRASELRIHDIQGYNPLQLGRYDEFITAMNGRTQGYRQEYIFEQGVQSRLLNLLNTRYIVVPRFAGPTREDLKYLHRTHQTRFLGSRVRVLENEAALPRAWIVHEARQVQRGEALTLLGAGSVDPRRVALIEETPPKLSQPEDPSRDRVAILTYRLNKLVLRTNTRARGMLVISEVYYPAWKAYVDGKPARTYVTDHVLRGVVVPKGTHTIELRIESGSLRLGAWITLATLLVLAALLLLPLGRRWQLRFPRARLGNANQEDRERA